MRKTKTPVITDEIATTRNDIVQDYLGNTVINPDKVLKTESGGRGIELYEDLLRDSEVHAALQTRKLAVIAKEWEVVPASDDAKDIKIAEFVKDVFLHFPYDAFRQSLLSGIVLGFKPAEVMWEYSEGDIWIKEIIGRASRRFTFDLQGKLRLLTLQNMIEGVEVPDRKFVVFRNVSDSGSYFGDGLGRSLYWPVWFRKNGIKFWAIFCDKFGSPTALGKYPPGTPPDKQSELLNAINAIQQESGVIIPEGMVIELLEATRAGSINTYESFCAYQDKAINKILLGHSAATEATPGRLGNENQAGDIRRDYIKADADALCECQNNTLIRWLVDYNFPDVNRYPKVWIRTEPEEDLKPLIERDRILVKEIGLPITKKYFYETYGIPQPEQGDEVIEPQNAGVQEYSEPGRFSPEQQAIERLVEKVVPDAAKTFRVNEEKILRAVKSASSYEDAMTKVLELYPDMKMDSLAELLERSTLSAQIFGGYTIKESMRARP